VRGEREGGREGREANKEKIPTVGIGQAEVWELVPEVGIGQWSVPWPFGQYNGHICQ